MKQVKSSSSRVFRAAPSTSDSMIRTRSTAAARFITPTAPSSRASTLMTIEMEKELTLIPTEILSRVTGRFVSFTKLSYVNFNCSGRSASRRRHLHLL